MAGLIFGHNPTPIIQNLSGQTLGHAHGEGQNLSSHTLGHAHGEGQNLSSHTLGHAQVPPRKKSRLTLGRNRDDMPPPSPPAIIPPCKS